MEKNKTHYRKVFKSDHLSCADLEDLIEEKCELKFTIIEVKQEIGVMVAGKLGNFNIAYFKEPIKRLVLNATNSKVLRLITGSPFIEDWKNIYIELYIDERVKFKGDVISGVRIRLATTTKNNNVKKEFTENNFENAKKAGATIEKIKTIYSITPEMEKKYIDYVTKK